MLSNTCIQVYRLNFFCRLNFHFTQPTVYQKADQLGSTDYSFTWNICDYNIFYLSFTFLGDVGVTYKIYFYYRLIWMIKYLWSCLRLGLNCSICLALFVENSNTSQVFIVDRSQIAYLWWISTQVNDSFGCMINWCFFFFSFGECKSVFMITMCRCDCVPENNQKLRLSKTASEGGLNFIISSEIV